MSAKTIASIAVMLNITLHAWLTAASVSVAPAPVGSNDLAVIEAASHSSQLQVVDVNIRDLSIAFGISIEGYKDGKATRLMYQPARQRWYPAAKDIAIKTCVSLQMNQPPMRDKTREVHGDHPLIPGSGSMRLGVAFQIISGAPNYGSDTSFIVTNSDFDLHESRPLLCRDLPFTIVNQETTNGVIPLIAILPQGFESNQLNGSVDASRLPDNTIVIYADYTRVTSDEDAWQTTLRSALTNGWGGIPLSTLGYTFFSEPAEVGKILESRSTNELFPYFAELSKERPEWKAGMVNGWSNIVTKGLHGKLETNSGMLQWTATEEIISRSTRASYSYVEEWLLKMQEPTNHSSF